MSVSASCCVRPLDMRRCRASENEIHSGSHRIDTRPDRRDVAFCLAFVDKRSHVRAPGVQRRALLVGPIVALVDADDSGAAPRNVVENGLSHLKADAELLQARSERAAKVVQDPTLRRAEGAGIETLLLGLLEQLPDDVLVEPRLRLAPSCKRAAAGRKNEVRPTVVELARPPGHRS